MKTAEFKKSLKGLSKKDLETKVSELEHEMMNLRFRHSSGQLQQVAQIADLRRNIARAKTAINAPVASEEVAAK